MPAEMHLIATPQGRLWIMPHPDPADLPGQMTAFRKAGMERLISMLATAEAAELGLQDEARQCATVGISFHAHPIADFGLPEIKPFASLTRQIAAWLALGEGIGVHCRAGIGRSGMVTAGTLIQLGVSAQDAISTVSVARGKTIPDTVEQGRFLSAFENSL